MDLFAPIDAYCERTSPAFWAEPLNAWSNAAFLLAAMLLLPRLWAVEGRPAGRRVATPARVLIVEMIAIGLGSFAFHTFANPLAAMADVGSIAAFILTFVGVYLRRVLGVSLVGAIVAPAMVFVASLGLPGIYPSFVLAYAPACLAAVTLGAVAKHRGIAGGGLLIATAFVFVLSMAVTGLDETLCPWWPYGTHFVWHLLNAAVLYLATRGLLRSAEPDGPLGDAGRRGYPTGGAASPPADSRAATPPPDPS